MQELPDIELLFMPGLDGTGISFEPLRQFMPSNVRTTITRYPIDRYLTFEETVKCALAQISTTPDLVIAESFSGPVAVALIGSGRLKPKGLILCATFARAPRQALMKILSRLPLELCLKLPFPSVLLRYVLGDNETAKMLLPMWQRVKTMVPSSIFAHRIRMVGQLDVRNWLTKLTIPCWYIQATCDRILPASTVLDFTQSMPHLVVKKIRGPHFVLQAQPEASVTIINEFVDLITSGCSGSPINPAPSDPHR